MISVYLASVDFHLTRLLWSKVSSYSANPLTRDKETETTSILVVTSPDLMSVLSSSGRGSGVGGPMEWGWDPVSTGAWREGVQSAGYYIWPQPSGSVWLGVPCPAPPSPQPLSLGRHWTWTRPKSQHCCDINQAWQWQRAASGTSPMAIFSCFSRETVLTQPASEWGGSGHCTPPDTSTPWLG